MKEKERKRRGGPRPGARSPGAGEGKNLRRRSLFLLCFAFAALAAIFIAGRLLFQAAGVTDFSRKNLPPCWEHPFGADWMGRDMLARTLAGLSVSLLIGAVAAVAGAGIAFLLGIAAGAGGKAADACIGWLIDLVQGIPHILLLLFISIACGKGFWGLGAGLVLTHWPSLARVVRAEVLQLKGRPYIQIAQKLGGSRLRIAAVHMAPHLLSQVAVGALLIFPHAILHEASVTFLGFGLPPDQPAIGVILSESVRYLATGKWWLAAFPGLSLVLVVTLFSTLGEHLRRLMDPASAHL